MRPYEEIVAQSKACRAAGIPMPSLTAEEKARAFGDPSCSGEYGAQRQREYEDACIARMEAGLPMSKSALKDARRWKRERNAN